MARLLVLAGLAALTVAEVAAVMALVGRLGAATTLLVLAADMLLGVVVIRWAARGPVEGRGWRLTAGAFIALPGLVLDVVGALLLVPGVQRWMSRRVTAGTESLLRRQGMRVVTVTDATGAERTTVVPGEVIPGQVVDDDVPGAESAPERAAEHGDPGPRIIRGEIAPPEDPPTT